MRDAARIIYYLPNKVGHREVVVPMNKKPDVTQDYDHKKDRFKITLKRFSLKKKWQRKELVKSLLGMLDTKSGRRKKGGRVHGDPIKNTRLEEVGD